MVTKYGRKIPQSYNANQPTAPRKRATEKLTVTRYQNFFLMKQPVFSSPTLNKNLVLVIKTRTKRRTPQTMGATMN